MLITSPINHFLIWTVGMWLSYKEIVQSTANIFAFCHSSKNVRTEISAKAAAACLAWAVTMKSLFISLVKEKRTMINTVTPFGLLDPDGAVTQQHNRKHINNSRESVCLCILYFLSCAWECVCVRVSVWHQAHIDCLIVSFWKCPTGVASCSCAYKEEVGMSGGMKEAAETQREPHTCLRGADVGHTHLYAHKVYT